jgi:hypothetical protein
MNKNILPKNQKGQVHGYSVIYIADRLIRCNYKFDSISGYRENHFIKHTLFFIK